MAEAVVSSTLENISYLIKNEVKFLSGVSDQVHKIRKEFEWMQCFLHDVDARKNQEQRLQRWVKDIRSLAYRAENAIEMYAVEVSSRRGRGIKKVLKRFACILSEAIALHKVGQEIASINRQIKELSEDLKTFDVKAINRGEGTSSGNERQMLLRKTYGHQVEEYFVGMKDDMRDLVPLLMDDDPRHRVISIWGMGGAGKTTIAQKIFNRDDVRRRFDAFAWVCITQECQIQSVFKDIMEQLCPKEAGGKEIISRSGGQVVGALYQLQKEQRCLIVLDDIWKLEDWMCLKPGFPDDASCSKTLLTTRIKAVAEVGHLHELNSLKEDEALELLRKKAFPEDLKLVDSEFEPLGKEMIHKCGNHPLAVSVLGGILRGKNSVSDWKMVNDNMDSYLKRGEKSKEQEGRILQVLSLSYNELPYHLKPCFLYLGAFRENFYIDLETAYLMWMAEGIVLSEDQLGDESMMDVAERYLDELAHRSMVQVQIIDGRLKQCRLHDLMRDLCSEKAKEEEFLEVMRLPGDQSEDITSLNGCRLVIHLARKAIIGKWNDNIEMSRQLRSLCFFRHSYPPSDFETKHFGWFGKFKFLRILLFESVSFLDRGFIPKEIGKLIHLRLLSFKYCRLTELPSAIGDFPYLQTLDLRVREGIEIPNVLWKLKRLRHLYLPKDSDGDVQIKGKDKLRLHGLGELELLFGFHSPIMEASDLSKLTKLQRFEGFVSGTESLSLVMNSIQHVKRTELWIDFDSVTLEEGPFLLRKVLMCHNLQNLAVSGYIGMLPNHESNFLQSLIKLKLEKSGILVDPMKMLEKLPNLQTLMLGRNSYVGKEMTCRPMGFRKLMKLRLVNLHNLETWSIEPGAMPSLVSLDIYVCKRLEMIPDGLRFITTLQRLYISNMRDGFGDKIHSKMVEKEWILTKSAISLSFIYGDLSAP